MAWFRRFYGENPLHLLALLGCFALVGGVVSMVWTEPSAIWLLVWFAGAVIGHDLVLYPLYALADRSLVLSRWVRRRVSERAVRVPATNHVRVPVLLSGLLGLAYLSTLTDRGDVAFFFAAGIPAVGHLRAWLLLTAGLFLGSAVLYALRLGRAATRPAAGSAPLATSE